jgi:hypothetical protein
MVSMVFSTGPGGMLARSPATRKRTSFDPTPTACRIPSRIRFSVAQRNFNQRSDDHAFAADAEVDRVGVPDRLFRLALPGEIGPGVRCRDPVPEYVVCEPVLRAHAARADGLFALAATLEHALKCRCVEPSDEWRGDVGCKLRSGQHHGQLHFGDSKCRINAC